MKEAEIIEQQSAARQPAAVQAAPASDYSAQWAEYYRWVLVLVLVLVIMLMLTMFCRSIGKVKEAEAIEQQMRAKGGSVPPSGAPQVSAPTLALTLAFPTLPTLSTLLSAPPSSPPHPPQSGVFSLLSHTHSSPTLNPTLASTLALNSTPQYGGAPQHAAPYGGGQQYQPGPQGGQQYY